MGVLRFLFLIPLSIPAPGVEDRARAEAEVRRLREARERAYEGLAAAYAQSEAWFLRVKEGGAGAAHAALETAARAALDALTVEEREGRMDPAGRARAQAFLRQKVAAALASAEVPAALVPSLSARLGDALAGENPAPPPEAVASAFAAILDLERPFHESWNERIFREAPPAKEFAAADRALLEAATRLERIVRPDRYHPAYASTPEGMLLVPGGSYRVGNESGWDLDTDRTRKSYEVQLRSFYIDRTEVTNRRYRKFLDSLPPADAGKRVPSTWPRTAGEAPVPPPGKEDHPVTGVTLEDALAFAASIDCRIPTEDEWAVAARGPETFLYAWGNVWDSSRSNHAGSGLNQTAPVGSFPSDLSPFGCLDMSGNACEWTATYPDGRPVTKLRENANVVLRGGSFRRPGSRESASWRWAYPALTTREADLGFRCAKDAPER